MRLWPLSEVSAPIRPVSSILIVSNASDPNSQFSVTNPSTVTGRPAVPRTRTRIDRVAVSTAADPHEPLVLEVLGVQVDRRDLDPVDVDLRLATVRALPGMNATVLPVK